jgi:hypothetical protein
VFVNPFVPLTTREMDAWKQARVRIEFRITMSNTKINSKSVTPRIFVRKIFRQLRPNFSLALHLWKIISRPSATLPMRKVTMHLQVQALS